MILDKMYRTDSCRKMWNEILAVTEALTRKQEAHKTWRPNDTVVYIIDPPPPLSPAAKRTARTYHQRAADQLREQKIAFIRRWNAAAPAGARYEYLGNPTLPLDLQRIARY
jgi:hypothetical protein